MAKFYDIVALDIVISDRVSCLSSFLQLYRKKCDLKQIMKCTIFWCNWRYKIEHYGRPEQEDDQLLVVTKDHIGTDLQIKSQIFGIWNAFGNEIFISTNYFLQYFQRHTGIK